MRYPSIMMDLTFPLINFCQRLYASYNGVITTKFGLKLHDLNRDV